MGAEKITPSSSGQQTQGDVVALPSMTPLFSSHMFNLRKEASGLYQMFRGDMDAIRGQLELELKTKTKTVGQVQAIKIYLQQIRKTPLPAEGLEEKLETFRQRLLTPSKEKSKLVNTLRIRRSVHPKHPLAALRTESITTSNVVSVEMVREVLGVLLNHLFKYHTMVPAELLLKLQDLLRETPGVLFQPAQRLDLLDQLQALQEYFYTCILVRLLKTGLTRFEATYTSKNLEQTELDSLREQIKFLEPQITPEVLQCLLTQLESFYDGLLPVFASSTPSL